MTFKPMQMAQCAGPPWSTIRAALEVGARSGVPHPGGGSGQRRLSVGAWEAGRLGPRLPRVRGPGDPLSAASARSRAGSAAAERFSSWAQPVRTDLSRAAREMETHPWVASVRLERRLPGEVLASVVEHRPAALVQLGALYVLDDEGVSSSALRRRTPWISRSSPGSHATPGTSACPSSSSGCRRAAPARQLAGLGNPIGRVSECGWRDGGFTLFAHDGTAVQEVRLGSNDISLKLRRLAQVRAALPAARTASRIDLTTPARPDRPRHLADKR